MRSFHFFSPKHDSVCGNLGYMLKESTSNDALNSLALLTEFTSNDALNSLALLFRKWAS